MSFFLDERPHDFDRFVTNRTKMIIINSPNNPRGKTYNLEELSYLNRLAQKHNLPNRGKVEGIPDTPAF